MKIIIIPVMVIGLVIGQLSMAAQSSDPKEIKALKPLSTQENTPNNLDQAPAIIKRCNQCHGPQGEATMPDWPPISTLSEQAIIAKLKGHRAKLVPDSMMQKVAHDLTDCEIKQIAQYYGTLNKKTSKQVEKALQ